MVEKGDLIGIADGEVFFVGNTKDVDGTFVVDHIDGYRPVSVENFEYLRDKDRMINEDEYDSFHCIWKQAVADDRTELGYEDYAEWLWDQEDMSYDEPLWFYGQDCSGYGSVLIEDMEFHEKIKADLEPLIGEEIGSWEWSCWTSPEGWRDNKPLKWDVIYNQEAVDACNRYSDVKDCNVIKAIGF